MQKDRQDGCDVRGETRAPKAQREVFTCGQEGCHRTGCAEEMFNTSCDPRLTPRAKLLTKVRCGVCAKKIAESNGKQLREPGCGVYPLCRTLKKLEEISEIDAQRAGTIRWIEEKKAAEAATVRAADKQQRQEEARYERQDMIRSYARLYAEAPVCGPSHVHSPAQRFLQDADEHLTCGLPIGCCRHDRPADRYITVMGEVVGICRGAAYVFTEVFKANEKDERFRKLLSTADPEQAKRFAAKWLGQEVDDEE